MNEFSFVNQSSPKDLLSQPMLLWVEGFGRRRLPEFEAPTPRSSSLKSVVPSAARASFCHAGAGDTSDETGPEAGGAISWGSCWV